MKPDVDLEVLSKTLRRQFGQISNLRPIAEGEESRAFTAEGAANDLVIRVNRSPAGFLKDAFAYRNFSRPTLPMPEVLLIAPYGEGYSYCLSRRAAGETLQELAPAKLTPVLDHVAAALTAMAASDVSGIGDFGPFDEDGAGSYPSWRQFVLAPCNEYDWNRVTSCLHRNAVDPLLEHLSRLSEGCPEVRALVHGDFGSNNVLTDGFDVTAVIDWSEAMVGDPLFDVANIFFWRTWLACMEAQAQHFERGGLAASDRTLQCYQLRIGLQEAYSSALSGDTTMARWALQRCRDTLC